MLILPLSWLWVHMPVAITGHIRNFTAYHDRAPDENSTLRDWLAVLSFDSDWQRALAHYGESGRHIAVEAAVKYARRALQPGPGAPPPRVNAHVFPAIELAEKWLADPASVAREELDQAARAACGSQQYLVGPHVRDWNSMLGFFCCNLASSSLWYLGGFAGDKEDFLEAITQYEGLLAGRLRQTARTD